MRRSSLYCLSLCLLFATLFATGGCVSTYTYKKANDLPLERVCDEKTTPRGELLMDAHCGVEITRMTAESACEAGNGEGCAMAALLTLGGKSVDNAVNLGEFTGDRKRARRLAHLGCNRDNEASCLLESVALLQSPAPSDQAKGLRLMEERCENGMGEICYMLGSIYEESGTTMRERTRSVELYQASCNAKTASGCFKYAQLLEKGFGVSQSSLRAQKYYNRACDLNHASACSQVDRDLPDDHEELLNEFVRVSKRSFIEMMKTGCTNGFRHGCTLAGRLVDRGEIRTRYVGHKTAVELFELGCDRGAAASCYHLARKTKAGQGTEANTATAADLAQKACNLGHNQACELHRDYQFRLFDSKDAAAVAKKCAQGDARSCYLAGHAFAYDVNFDADYERALDLLQQGCDLDYADACESAGVMLGDEETGPYDMQAALTSYRRGCELGADYACYALGMSYEHGRGVEEDFEMSARLLRLACERDFGQACGELGSYFEVGESFDQDLEQAEELYSRGCAAGNVNSCTNLADLLQRHADSDASFSRAFELYELSCANDEPRACVALGNMLTQTEDEELIVEGLDFLERACMLEHGPGCRDFGVHYYRGEIVDEDHERALMLWQQACDLDDPTGCVYLGEMYRDGEGVETDAARAMDIFSESCDEENSTACIRQAEMYLYNSDTEYEPTEALQLYDTACHAGDSTACSRAAELLADGIHVEQDFAKAVQYLEVTCERDGVEHCDSLDEFLRLGIGTDQDVERANKYSQQIEEKYREACAELENASCAHAAHLIAHGRGADTDWSAGRQYLRAQCTHDVEEGCREMAEQKGTGEIFKRDRKAAVKSLTELCEEGNQTACQQAAFFLRFGRTGEVDFQHATDLWREQCDDDDASSACVHLGSAYFHGLGVEQDRQRGIDMLAKTCTDATRAGCIAYVMTLAQHNPNAIGDKHFARAENGCEARNWAACARQGEMLARGLTVDRDLDAATDIFTRGCESGDPDACPRAEAMSRHASGLESSASRAAEACNDGGSPQVCIKAGLAADFGIGIEASAQRAAAHYERACAAGDALGCQLRVSLNSYAKAPLVEDALYEHVDKACSGGSASYNFRHGVRLTSQDWDAGVQKIDRACDEGLTQACLWLNANGEGP